MMCDAGKQQRAHPIWFQGANTRSAWQRAVPSDLCGALSPSTPLAPEGRGLPVQPLLGGVTHPCCGVFKFFLKQTGGV